MRNRVLAPFLILAQGFGLSSCLPPVGANCNEDLDGLTVDEAREILEPETGNWTCTDTSVNGDPEIIVWSAEVEIDGQKFSDEPYCICAVDNEADPDTVHDCQMTMDFDERSEIVDELCPYY